MAQRRKVWCDFANMNDDDILRHASKSVVPEEEFRRSYHEQIRSRRSIDWTAQAGTGHCGGIRELKLYYIQVSHA